MAERSHPERASRADWLDAGLALLAAEGEEGLTIEAACKRMGRTKGSFYHHFDGRDDFVVALLAHWEETYTARVIAELEPLEGPLARLRALGERTARDVDLKLERTLRLWSEREPAARAVLSRVDRAREDYLYRELEAAFGDPRRARLAARAHMALLVGAEMLYHDLSRGELRELNAFVERLGFLPEARRRGD